MLSNRQNKTDINTTNKNRDSAEPWAVDRIGRFLAGMGIIFFTLIGYTLSNFVLIITLMIGVHLFFSSILNSCFLRNTLVKLGAKEREELYYPDGTIRNYPTSINFKPNSLTNRKSDQKNKSNNKAKI